MDLVWLKGYENAVCNDGSPAGYYFKNGTGDNNIWIVYLEGGGWCGDQRDCEWRCQYMSAPWCSSDTWTDTRQVVSGLFVTNKERLRGAYNVFVPQCSSDAHMGNGESFGMQFRGAKIVEAVFKDLVRLGLGRDRHDLVLFGGESAGARGAMVNLDYVTGFLGERERTVDVVGFLDSPLWIDMPPKPGSRFAGFRRQSRNVLKHANVTRLGDICPGLYPQSQRFKCIMGQYRLPHMRTPYFIVASQYDSFQLGLNLGHPFPVGQEDEEYAERFRNSTRRSLSSIAMMAMQNNSHVGVYSSACYVHARSWCQHGLISDTAGATNRTVADELMVYLSRALSPGVQIVTENCKGLGCAQGCLDLDPQTLALLPAKVAPSPEAFGQCCLWSLHWQACKRLRLEGALVGDLQ
eukprot:CAMPEP_0171075066 /NCGR_PEP_ID=MMETSP0766_2-20121228/12548_1 /TAXON_ID=439317 /ORGANISM="Gambierdiscus australes, Strain CAWD 149" /LENGTH=406 /DNA_ID=CAMNT_0011531901 /DNA_START=17 /DNA_END=1238 /DNA_ORIENTATION=+